MRLIDADEFAEDICELLAIDEHSANAVIFLLHEQPTVDIKTEVAREIIGYVKKHLRIKRKQIDIPFTSRDMRNYQCGAIDIIEYFEELVTELKNKYTKD